MWVGKRKEAPETCGGAGGREASSCMETSVHVGTAGWTVHLRFSCFRAFSIRSVKRLWNEVDGERGSVLGLRRSCVREDVRVAALLS